MVKQLRNEGSVTIAESFSHAQAPTLDGTYDRVYMLVLVGMNPASARAVKTTQTHLTPTTPFLLKLKWDLLNATSNNSLKTQN